LITVDQLDSALTLDLQNRLFWRNPPFGPSNAHGDGKGEETSSVESWSCSNTAPPSSEPPPRSTSIPRRSPPAAPGS